MRAGLLQQVDAPRELYANPRNLFVAGFIGSPAMNFFGGMLENNAVRTPMGEVPLSDETRRKLEQHGTGGRNVVVGVRPEDFEDARFAPEGHQGFTFDASIELTESMGSEIYAHFDFEGEGADIESEELRELQQDAGTEDVPKSGVGGHAVARVDAASGVRWASARSSGSTPTRSTSSTTLRRRLVDPPARRRRRRNDLNRKAQTGSPRSPRRERGRSPRTRARTSLVPVVRAHELVARVATSR